MNEAMVTTTGKQASATVERFTGKVIHFMATTIASDETAHYLLKWSLAFSGTSISLDVVRKSTEQTAAQYTISLVDLMQAMGAIAIDDIERKR